MQQGAIGDQVTHSWTAGYQLAGLEQQRPRTQKTQYIILYILCSNRVMDKVH